MFAKFDQRLIDFLTMICWWSEVRWEKNNIYWVHQVDTIEMILTVVLWYLVGHYSVSVFTTTLSYFFIAHALIRLTLVVFVREFYIRRILGKYPQGFPNSCRVSSRHVKERNLAFFVNLTSVCTLFLLWQLTDFLNGYPATVMFILYVITAAFSTVYYYFLACDSLPPQEKLKRKSEIEAWQGNFQPIHISGN